MEERGMDFDSFVAGADTGVMTGFGGSKVEFSKPLLVMESIRLCVNRRSVEMKIGYVNEKVDKFGNTIKETIPDTRQAFISSVTALKNLLEPEGKSNSEFQKALKEFNKRMDNTFDKYAYRTYTIKEWIDPQDPFENIKKVPFILDDAEKSMPSIGSIVLLLRGQTLKEFPKGWDTQTNSYIDECIKHHDFLFAQLNVLVADIGYFKKRAVGEETEQVDLDDITK